MSRAGSYGYDKFGRTTQIEVLASQATGTGTPGSFELDFRNDRLDIGEISDIRRGYGSG